jgi:hypothetical protein
MLHFLTRTAFSNLTPQSCSKLLATRKKKLGQRDQVEPLNQKLKLIEKTNMKKMKFWLSGRKEKTLKRLLILLYFNEALL